MQDILGIWITIKKMTFPPRCTKNTGLNTGVNASIAVVCYIKMNKKRGLFFRFSWNCLSWYKTTRQPKEPSHILSMISPTRWKTKRKLAQHRASVLLWHILMVKMKPKPKASTSSTKCHWFCLLDRIPITCVIYWSSSCRFPKYLVDEREEKKKKVSSTIPETLSLFSI